MAGPPALGRTSSLSLQVLAPHSLGRTAAMSLSSGDQPDSSPLPRTCECPFRSTTMVEGKMLWTTSKMPVLTARRVLSCDQSRPLLKEETPLSRLWIVPELLSQTKRLEKSPL